MGAKSWQIAVIAGGLLLGGGLLVWQTMGSGDQEAEFSDTMMLVDVATGQLYEVNLRKTRPAVPAKSPETGQRTLVTVHKSKEGQWVVTPTELDEVEAMKDANKVIDLASGIARRQQQLVASVHLQRHQHRRDLALADQQRQHPLLR